MLDLRALDSVRLRLAVVDDADEDSEPQDQPKTEASVEDRNEFRRARAMHVDVEKGGL